MRPNRVLYSSTTLRKYRQILREKLYTKKGHVRRKKNEYWLSESGDQEESAHNLFKLIRALDKNSKFGFYCQRAKNSGIGLAINDRLSRAETKLK